MIPRLPARPTDDDLGDEVRAHLDMAIRDRVARGESPEEARLAARREFGNVTMVRETTRDMWGWRWIDRIRQDSRYAIRSLGRSPGLVITILLTLTLGVGAVGAVFSVIDRIFLQVPPGVRDAGTVARIVFFRPRAAGQARITTSTSFPDIDDFRAATAGRASIEAYELETNPPFNRGLPQSLAFTTTGYFDLLGVKPALGRFYTADENRLGAPTPVIVLSNALWQSRYGGNASVLDSVITIDSVAFRVIGVAQAGFAGLDVDAIDMWVPFSAREAPFSGFGGTVLALGSVPFYLQHHGSGVMPVIRLNPGVDRRAIEAALTTEYRRTATGDDARDSAVTVRAAPLIEARGPQGIGAIDARRLGIVLTVTAVILITLLICVANVASLLFLRALRRRHEIAVRLALGISRARLIGQLVTESLLLAGAAGVLSLSVAYFGGSFLRTSLLSAIHWPTTVVGFRGSVILMAVALVAGLAAGLIPGVFASDPRLLDTLKTGTPGAGASHVRVRSMLIVLQAALCVVLLVCSGVFVQSLHRALTLNLGFDADRIVDIETDLVPRNAEPVLQEAKARLTSVPGVERVSITAGGSLSGSGESFNIRLSNGSSIPMELRRPTSLSFNTVDSTFFRTEGIPILRGRAIDARDVATSLPVAVISEQTALRIWGARAQGDEQIWAGRDPLGDCFHADQDESGKPIGPCIVIVGIAGDVRNTVTGPMPMRLYFPLTQPPRYQWPSGEPRYMGNTLVIRMSRPPTSDQLRAIAAISNALPRGELGPAEVKQPAVELGPEIKPWRVAAILFSGFGVVTLFLAGVGLYGLVGYDVTCRTREIGVRIALGARAADILEMFVGSGLRVALIATVTGVVAALASVRVIASLLFDTSPADPTVLVFVVTTLLAVAILASLLPAWRATRVDPVVVLRAD